MVQRCVEEKGGRRKQGGNARVRVVWRGWHGNDARVCTRACPRVGGTLVDDATFSSAKGAAFLPPLVFFFGAAFFALPAAFFGAAFFALLAAAFVATQAASTAQVGIRSHQPTGDPYHHTASTMLLPCGYAAARAQHTLERHLLGARAARATQRLSFQSGRPTRTQMVSTGGAKSKFTHRLGGWRVGFHRVGLLGTAAGSAGHFEREQVCVLGGALRAEHARAMKQSF